MSRAPDTTRLLRDHARTFALTLRLLPRDLREPLGIAYLLARASDTIADTAGVPRERRLELLRELDAMFRGGDSATWRPPLEAGFSSSEMELLRAVPALLAAWGALPEREEERETIRVLWLTILQGQMFDVQRFAPGAGPLTREELELYCGWVAGSVGVAWTSLISAHSPGTLRRPREDMERLGMDYGRGLQLVNILRDRSADRLLGRRYVEDDDLPGLLELAGEWLGSGGVYLSQLLPGRILTGSALPYDLAVRTLAAIRNSPETPRVKLPRGEVRLVLLRSMACLCFPRSVDPAS